MQRSFKNSALTVVILSIISFGGEAHAQKFYADDPIGSDGDDVLDAGALPGHALADYYDFILHTFSDPADPSSGRAANINTLGEVPDSAWFTNRHGRSRTTLAELVRGPDETGGPSPEGLWMVTEAKTEGVTPGFRIRDSRGDIYVVKFDPPDNPEMATAAEAISTKFFYAMGYNTPENYLVYLERERLRVDPEAMLEEGLGRERPLREADLDAILERTHLSGEGTYRAIASRFIPGQPLGPFQYYGTRPDDPNDIFPHENRRELRGLRALASWLNHDDSRAVNTQDTLITHEDGSTFVRHYLIDFGSTLGSGSVGAQGYRAGWEYLWEPRPVLGRILTLGLWDREWIRVDYPDLPSIGRFESAHFKPGEWKPEYPNPAFERAGAEDGYWGARIAMAFSDDEIRALVETGGLSDPAAARYLADTIIQRRDAVGRYWFAQVNTADNFRLVDNERLRFDRLASVFDFSSLPSDTGGAWYRFDNSREESTPVGVETPYDLGPLALPDAVLASRDGEYFRLRLREETRFVDVYLRNSGGRIEIVGIERE